jgi:VanZ family protein
VFNQKVIRGVFFVLLGSILVLSLLPIGHPSASPNDKVNHFIAYGSLMLVGYGGYRSFKWVGLFVIAWGVLIEGLQGLTSYRLLSYADILANSAGVVLGAAAIVGYQTIKRRISTKQDKQPNE